MDAPPTLPLPLPLLLTALLVQLPLMIGVPLLLGRWLRRKFDVGWAVFGVSRTGATAVALLLALAGCRAPGEGPPTPPPPTPPPRVGPAPPASFAVGSPAFREGDLLPGTFTCDGRSVSPPLTWEAVPYRTRSLALMVENPDAPGGSSIHWVVWGIPASTRELPEGARATGGMREGANGSGAVGWGGPCPTPGPAHRYHFRLYALDFEPDLPAGASALHLHAAMYRHVIAESVLTARYARARR